MLFDACTIGGIHAACRIVRSATFEGMADAEGRPTDKLCHMYEALAEGGTGIIITGMIAASRLEPHQHHQILLDDDSCIAPLMAVTQAVHDKGGKIIAQIVLMGSAIMVPEGENRIIVSPSGIPDKSVVRSRNPRHLRLSRSSVSSMMQPGSAARPQGRIDGVQFHGAHGYLASKFLTPYYNQRSDEYGGDLMGRARFLRQCIASIKKRPAAISLYGSN